MQTDCFPDATPDWAKSPVSALAEINPRYPVLKGQTCPFIEMAAVAENFGGIQNIDLRKMEGSGLTRFKAGDTLFAKITPCPENGKVAHVSSLPAEVGLGSTEFIVLSPKEDCDARFLYHLLCCHAVRGRATARMEGSTGRQRVPDDIFKKRLMVPVPPPEEQAAIARILDAVGIAIERTREAVERAQVLQTSLLTDAFERMQGERKRLGEFTTDVRYGTSQAANERGWGSPTLRIPNVVGDQLTLDDLVYVDLKPADVTRLKLRDGDLLLVRTNGNPHYVGRSAVFKAPDDRPWIYASYLIRVRLTGRMLPDYVNIFLGMERGRRELLRRVTTSAGNHNINSNSIRLLSIPVTESIDTQEHIIEVARTCRAHVAGIQQKLAALAELKKSLLYDLLTGKVRVNHLTPDWIPNL